jgi:HSP20 family protein
LVTERGYETDGSSATSQWSPAVDVREYSDRFQLLLDVPGVEPKDVEITPDNGILTVSGNRIEEKGVGSNGADQPQQQRIERPVGQFHRRFILPDTADAENVNASGRSGVLEIVIPSNQKRSLAEFRWSKSKACGALSAPFP